MTILNTDIGGGGITFIKHWDHYWVHCPATLVSQVALQKNPVLSVRARNFHLYILQSSSLCNIKNLLLSVLQPSYVVEVFTYAHFSPTLVPYVFKSNTVYKIINNLSSVTGCSCSKLYLVCTDVVPLSISNIPFFLLVWKWIRKLSHQTWQTCIQCC